MTDEQLETLVGALSEDPRPSYQRDENRIYGMRFSKWDVKFSVSGNKLFVSGFEKLK